MAINLEEYNNTQIPVRFGYWKTTWFKTLRSNIEKEFSSVSITRCESSNLRSKTNTNLRPRFTFKSLEKLTPICFINFLKLESSGSSTIVFIGVPFLQGTEGDKVYLPQYFSTQ